MRRFENRKQERNKENGKVKEEMKRRIIGWTKEKRMKERIRRKG